MSIMEVSQILSRVAETIRCIVRLMQSTSSNRDTCLSKVDSCLDRLESLFLMASYKLSPLTTKTLLIYYMSQFVSAPQSVLPRLSALWAMAPLQEFRLIELESSSSFTHQMTADAAMLAETK